MLPTTKNCLVALSISAGLPLTVWANRPPPQCCVENVASYRALQTMVSWELSLGEYELTRAEAEGDVVAIAVLVATSDAGDCDLGLDDVLVDAELNSGHQDLLESPYELFESAEGEVTDDELFDGSSFAYGFAGFECTQLFGIMVTTTSFGTESGSLYDLDPEFAYDGSYASSGHGAAAAALSMDWDLQPVEPFPDPWLFTVEVHIMLGWGIAFSDPCEESAPPTDNDPVLLGVDFVSIGVQADDGGTQVSGSGIQGVIATFDDGSTVRLGFADDSEFDPTTSGGGWAIEGDADISVPAQSPYLDGITLTSNTDSFQSFDGNLNRDVDGDDKPFICWVDWLLMFNLQGTEIGDGQYIARADFDLNGEIDQADGAAMRLLPCVADMNCDGVVDYPDYTEFLNLYDSPSDPTADINLDSVIDVNDFLEFLNMYNVACG